MTKLPRVQKRVWVPKKKKELKELHAKFNIISIEEVERRLLTAHMTLEALPELDPLAPAPTGYGLDPDDPDYLQKLKNKFEKYGPSAFDVSDCDVAMEWMINLQLLDKQIIQMVSEDLEFKYIGEVIGRDTATAKSRFRNSISDCWLEASIQKQEAAKLRRFQREIRQGKRSRLSCHFRAEEPAIY